MKKGSPNILVTGGAGFIGSNCCAALGERGYAVAVCDWIGTGSKWRNLLSSDVRETVTPEKLEGWLAAHLHDLESVVHLGAITSTTEKDVDLIVDTNVNLSWRLWNWCAEHRKRFIYASSAATYGDRLQGFADDASPQSLRQLRPLNPYAWSKHEFDCRVADAVANREPQPRQWAGLKFFNVYGPNEYHKGEMQSIIAQRYRDIAEGREVALFAADPRVGDGADPRRDFVFVEDCVAVLMWLLDHPAVNGLFNVGTGTARTFQDALLAVGRQLGREPRIVLRPMPETLRSQYQHYTCADTSRLRAAGYDGGFRSLEEGVSFYLGRYLQAESPYR